MVNIQKSFSGGDWSSFSGPVVSGNSEIVRIKDVRHPGLDLLTRDLEIYLPPGYSQRHRQRHPVVYMHDGQNLFDDRTAFGGVSWDMQTALDRLILTEQIPPIILVGIHSTMHRKGEMTFNAQGKYPESSGRKYGRLILEHIKPHVDSAFRTRPDRDNTGMIGSSLGGLVTLFLGQEHPSQISRLGALSPAIWWADGRITERFKIREKPDLRIWVDVGHFEFHPEEGDPKEPELVLALYKERAAEFRQAVHDLMETLADKGWRPGVDLGGGVFYQGDCSAQHHSEVYWRMRVYEVLKFLFGRSDAY